MSTINQLKHCINLGVKRKLFLVFVIDIERVYVVCRTIVVLFTKPVTPLAGCKGGGAMNACAAINIVSL